MKTHFTVFPEKTTGKFKFKNNCVLHRWVFGIGFYFHCRSWGILVHITIGPFLFILDYELEENKNDKYSFPRFLRTGNFKYVPNIVTPLDDTWYEPEYVPDEHNSLDILWFKHLKKEEPTTFFNDPDEEES